MTRYPVYAIALLIVTLVFAADELQQVLPDDSEANAEYGFSIGLDGSFLVVGAHLEDESGATDRGAAYVHRKTSGGTDGGDQVEKLVAGDAAQSDQPGESVAISGNTVIVGSLLDNNAGGTDAGSASIFQRHATDETDWSQQQAQLLASDSEVAGDGTSSGDNSGISVSISGSTAIVGAPMLSDTTGNQGAAFMFHQNHEGADSWNEVAQLFASDPGTFDFFGRAVAVGGDRAVGGAYRWEEPDADPANAGKAYVLGNLCPCPADSENDETVDVGDLLDLLAE
jgi:hypothetical protein